MDASLWVAKTGLNAQQTRMSVISNNLANVNTNGFKRDRAVFEDLLYQNIRQAGGQTGADHLHRLASCWVLARVLSQPKKCRVKAT